MKKNHFLLAQAPYLSNESIRNFFLKSVYSRCISLFALKSKTPTSSGKSRRTFQHWFSIRKCFRKKKKTTPGIHIYFKEPLKDLHSSLKESLVIVLENPSMLYIKPYNPIRKGLRRTLENLGGSKPLIVQ